MVLMFNQRGNFQIILGVLVLLFVIGGGAYYLGTQYSSRPTTQINTSSPNASQQTNVVTSPIPNPTATVNKKDDFKSYMGAAYTFMYPSEWKQTGPDQYLETVQLINPNKTVSITISKGQYPYGFSGPSDIKTNPITIHIDGKTIEARENVSGKGAYVDFSIGEYHILYGTDYPAVGTQASLTDYNSSKETIAEILSSFKLIQ